MVLIIIGVLLLLLKWAEIGPFATLSWWWITLPLLLAVAWFEIIEPMFGLDKRRGHDEYEAIKQERLKKQLDKKR
ncbi:MAG: TIGR04438 family Trp-rich protein [Burkholderiaceae bacterium]|nr:MAG: TIGR04438 family Trp-rich protein [Burkholderiaceae bacterium]